jgi:hypothetical protein
LPPIWATPFSAKTFKTVDTQVDKDEMLGVTTQIIQESTAEHDADTAAAHSTAERVLAAEATEEARNDEEPAPLLSLPPGLTLVQNDIRALADEIDWGTAIDELEDDWRSCVSSAQGE